jgi:hypothetical protein
LWTPGSDDEKGIKSGLVKKILTDLRKINASCVPEELGHGYSLDINLSKYRYKKENFSFNRCFIGIFSIG